MAAETKELIRAYGLPERALTEATLAGSRADATAHGEQADDASEQEHGNLCRQFSGQTLRTTVVTNWGPKFADRFYVKPAQINAADKAKKQDLLASLVPVFTTPDKPLVDLPKLADECEVKTVVGWTPPAPQPQPGDPGQGDGADDGIPDDVLPEDRDLYAKLAADDGDASEAA